MVEFWNLRHPKRIVKGPLTRSMWERHPLLDNKPFPGYLYEISDKYKSYLRGRKTRLTTSQQHVGRILEFPLKGIECLGPPGTNLRIPTQILPRTLKLRQNNPAPDTPIVAIRNSKHDNVCDQASVPHHYLWRRKETSEQNTRASSMSPRRDGGKDAVALCGGGGGCHGVEEYAMA